MLRFVIRHGETGVRRNDRKLHGIHGPPLNNEGKIQAQRLHTEFVKLNIDPRYHPVAVSEFLRTKQTAEEAGFLLVTQYKILNEISTGLKQNDLKKFINDRQLPQIVLDKAKELLDRPPKEKIWITHGLVIMGLHQLLGISEKPFDPPKGTINILEIT